MHILFFAGSMLLMLMWRIREVIIEPRIGWGEEAADRIGLHYDVDANKIKRFGDANIMILWFSITLVIVGVWALWAS